MDFNQISQHRKFYVKIQVNKHIMDPSNLNNSRKSPALSVYSIWFTYVYSKMFHDVPI